MPCASSAGVAAAGRLRTEDLDHADHRAHQAEQRRRRGDRAERVEVALQPMHGGAAGGLEGVAQGALSVMRGSAITARMPAASTVPSTELSASLLTTSDAGRWARVTEITSSSSRAGATRKRRRLVKRSMTSARAATEQISSGKIGQPAACSIENNMALSCDRFGRP